MTISIIAAISENNVIGKDNKLLWHISEDLKRFKKLTSGKPIIMGRKTYESLPFKPLPKRKNIVISTQNIKHEGAIVVNNFETALAECKKDDEVFICGGASIYKHFLPIANKMYLTIIHKAFEGDTLFPEINFNKWIRTSEPHKNHDLKSGLDYSFIDFVAKKKE